MEIKIRGEQTKAPTHLKDKLESGIIEAIVTYKINVTRGESKQFTEDDTDFDLTEVQFDDDSTWIGDPAELKELFDIEIKRSGGKEELLIPESISLDTNRGVFQKLKTKFISFIKYKAVELATLKIAQQIDKRKVKKQGLFKVDSDFKPIPVPKNEIADDNNALLFIHGTFSSFEGGFSSIGSGDDDLWKNLKDKYGHRIYAFNHHTLSVSPLENALQLIEELPDNINLHLITHSRGGIIGDILCKCDSQHTGFNKEEVQLLVKNDATATQIEQVKKLNKLRKQKSFTIKNYIRVACPASGTRLLSQRIDRYLNILNNVFRLSGTSLIASEIGDLVLHLIKQKANPDVLPGLDSMVPDSVFQKLLNNSFSSVKSNLSIVYSNAGQKNLLSRGIAFLIRHFIFNRDNDFVVDLSSMFFGVNRVNAIRGLEIKSPPVGHTSYFSNKQLRKSLFTELQQQYNQSEFEVKTESDADRSIKAVPWGKYMSPKPSGERPIVVVLPGILGSVLSKGNNIKWLDYGDILTKGIDELILDNNQKSDVKATHLISTSYRSLCEYLIDNGYDVVSFPYDWRLSVESEGNRLAKALKALMKEYSQPIKIMAHSMGGLIMKHVIAKHNNVYKQLCNLSGFRFIMLGTPWNGSFLITQFLTAQGKRFHALDKLSVLQKKEEILKVAHTFPGVLDLLPLGRDEAESEYDLTKLEDWKKIKMGSEEDFWIIPDDQLLKKYKKYQSNLKLADLDSKFVKYVAGKANWTVNGISISEEQTKPAIFTNASKINYSSTQSGDGSVTWKYGIPDEFQKTDDFSETVYTPNISFVESTHGDLSNDKSLFKGYLELLRYGETSQPEFSNTEPKSTTRGEVVLDDIHILSNNKEDLWGVLLGSDPSSRFDEPDDIRTINVQFTCGHLKRALHPILVGHQKSTSIKGSELAVDDELGGKLTELINLDLYPNEVETSEVILTNNEVGFKGAVIVGTGPKENQTGYLLERSVEKAVIKYLLTLSVYNNSERAQTNKKNFGLSSVFISSYYGGLSLDVSMDSIINGVSKANQAMKSIGSDCWIDDIEFVEIYEDRSERALLSLIDMDKRKLLDVPVNISKKCSQKEGRKLSLPIDHNYDWYTRYSITCEADKNDKCEEKKNKSIQRLLFRSAAGLAREEVKEGYTNKHMLDLLVDIIPKAEIDEELSKTLFALLIPNEFKTNFRRQGNILLVLDEITASYPWEMMAPDIGLNEPLAVKAPMIRQFSTENYVGQLNFISEQKAFIIGNPNTEGEHPDLPEARAETDVVNQLLRSAGYDNYYPDSIPPQEYIIKLLAHDYKIIHIAAHGVYDDDDDFAKIIIGPKESHILTAIDFKQMENTPEIAFINCCHVGKIDPNKEGLIRKRYKIASSIGVQLLNQGFKAVIVAGWAVDDAAAKTFAHRFYSELLDGATFGNAVRDARRDCHNQFPNKNTWGAYHCYGDPEYKLVSYRKDSSYDDTIYIKQQARIFLRNFANDAKHKKTREKLSIDRLHEIAYKIENSTFSHDAEILELLAFAYSEVLEWEAALTIFSNLFIGKKSGYSFKAYEKYHNIKVRHAYKIIKQNSDEEEVDKAYVSIEESINDLCYLVEKAETSERLSIIGSAYQRLYALDTKQDDLNQTVAYYKDAYLKCEVDNIQNYHYSLIVLLKAWFFQNSKVCDDNHPIISRVAESHEKLMLILEKELKGIQNSTDFWDEIALVSLLQYQLITCMNKKEIPEILKNMKTTFSNAWDIGGAFQHKSTEIEHMDFLIQGLKSELVKAKYKKLKLTSLEEYLEFLNNIGTE